MYVIIYSFFRSIKQQYPLSSDLDTAPLIQALRSKFDSNSSVQASKNQRNDSKELNKGEG